MHLTSPRYDVQGVIADDWISCLYAKWSYFGPQPGGAANGVDQIEHKLDVIPPSQNVFYSQPDPPSAYT